MTIKDVASLMKRASRSLKTARLILVDGDADAACSRAYYAMFYAVQAVLLASGHVEAAQGKSHSGLISAFGQHVVKLGVIPVEHGRALRAVFQLRAKADYSGDGVSVEDAQRSIDQAAAFIVAIDAHIQQQPG